MRIWLAASISPNAYGGVYRSMQTLASEFRRYGHKTELYFSHPERKQHWIRFSFALALRLFLFFWKRPHWIIARSTDGYFSATLVRILHMKTKVALHSHGWEERADELERRLPSSLITNPTTWKARLVSFRLLRRMVAKASIVMCGTIDETRWLKKRYPLYKSKFILVPNGVKATYEPFWPQQEERPPSYLMVGGFTWKKNIEYGLELFRRILEIEPGARLFLVGFGGLPKQKERLLFPLGDAAFTVDIESPEKMYRWYESCPVLIFPSRYEGGHPFTILEAQSKGCVVFASDIASNRECITPGVNGYLLSGANPVSDATFIHSVISNNDLMKKIGMGAWKKATRNRVQRQGQRSIKILLEKSMT